MSNSKILFSAPVNAPTVQNAAAALYDAGLLGAYYTNFGLPDDGRVLRTATALDHLLGTRLTPQLRRRAITEIPYHFVHLNPLWEVLRTVLSRSNFNEPFVRTVEAISLHYHDRHVSRRVKQFAAVYAYNRAAVESFRAAKKAGAFRILAVRDLEPNFYGAMRDQEYEKYPLLQTTEQKRFDAIENSLTAASKAEWDLADLVVMNSNMCRESYASYGDTQKVRVIPFGFPTPLDDSLFVKQPNNPVLRVMWSGTFSMRKGAHYLMQALKLLPQSVEIQLAVFGKQELPRAFFAEADRPIHINATVPRAQLFEEYRSADVLVLPTLADTFGMVISEGMSQGLPVITTPRAGASQFIRSGENGIVVPPCNAEALAEALLWCAENRTRLDDMRAEAFRTASSWQWSDFRRTFGQVIGDAIRQHH